MAGYDAYTAGIGEESLSLDLSPTATSFDYIVNMLLNLQPQHVVCTVGFNMGQPEEADLTDWWRWHYEANVMMPMRLLDTWLLALSFDEYEDTRKTRHYVAISSNSARLPRTRSAAYCASKAALSMALRVRAREERAQKCLLYGYEPGLLSGTPMTSRAQKDFSGPLTRMRPSDLVNGADPNQLAEMLVGNLEHRGSALNGVLLPYDADEL